jgi:hypothetical protein
MIHVLGKPFVVTLWESPERDGDGALRLEFETHQEAVAELNRQREAGLYRSGVAMHWRKVSDEWDLVAKYP